MLYLAAFFAGAFLCNGIPHFAAGLRGESFPTPFAKPRGVGNSSPLVNFLWGLVNLIVGLYLLSLDPAIIGITFDLAAALLGALAIGVYLSIHFGKVRAGKG